MNIMFKIRYRVRYIGITRSKVCENNSIIAYGLSRLFPVRSYGDTQAMPRHGRTAGLVLLNHCEDRSS